MADHFSSVGRDVGLQEKSGAETSTLVAEGLWMQSGWPSSHSSYKYFFYLLVSWREGGLFALDTLKEGNTQQSLNLLLWSDFPP